MPLWVQLWVALILVPVNLAPLLFLDRIEGPLVAVLAAGAIAFNAVLLLIERGFSKAMAFSHLVLWPPLVIGIALLALRGDLPPGGFGQFLGALAVVNAISLAFDLRDGWLWWKGDRAVAGR